MQPKQTRFVLDDQQYTAEQTQHGNLIMHGGYPNHVLCLVRRNQKKQTRNKCSCGAIDEI